MELHSSLMLALPEIILSLSGILLLIWAAWGGANSARGISIAAVAALVAAAVFGLRDLISPDNAVVGEGFFGQFRVDAYSVVLSLLIYASAIGTLILAPAFFREKERLRPEFPVLILFACVGMVLMVSAIDWLTLYIGLELNSLAAYVLASLMRDDERSAESGLKYFVLGALASGILLYGISLLYGFTGTTQFSGIRLALAGGLSNGALFGLVFVLAGLAFKVSAVPFHMWTPDVYEGAPTPVTTFFASAPKVAAMAVLVRVVIGPLGDHSDAWQQIIIFMSLASIVLGAAGAIGQTNIKRLLAYSSINNVGFMLIGLAAGTPDGIAAVITYLAIYVAMTLGSFACVLALRDEQGNQIEDIASLGGLSTRRPLLAWSLAAFMFSLAGIPPLFGFWGKFLVFEAAVEADMVALAAIGMAASVIGAFYYLKVVKVLFFDDDAQRYDVASKAVAETAVLVLCAIIVSPLGYLLTPLFANWSGGAAAALFGS